MSYTCFPHCGVQDRQGGVEFEIQGEVLSKCLSSWPLDLAINQDGIGKIQEKSFIYLLFMLLEQ